MASIRSSVLATLRTIPCRSATAYHSFSTAPRHFQHFLDATPAIFEKQISGEKIQLVDFYADWCGPCKVLSPVLERVVSPESGVDLITINTDEHQELAGRYKIAALPTVIAIRGGKVLDKFVGAQKEAAVRGFISNLLK